MGVEIQLDAMVTDVDRNGITVKDSDGTIRRIESRHARCGRPACQASPLGSDLAEQSGVEVDRAGRVKVLPDLRPGHPNVFVVGDMAAVEGVPGMAQGAIQGGKYAAKAIKAELQRRQRRRARAVQVLRQGLDGDRFAVQRGRQVGKLRIRRLHRLAGVARACT